MHDDESGSAQRDGWQPPEYVSPWIPASAPEERGAGRAPGSGEPTSDDEDTLAFGGDPAYGPGGYPPPGYVPPSYGQPGYGEPGYGQARFDQPGYGEPRYSQQPGYGQYPWSGYSAPPPPPRSGFGRALAYVAVAVLAAAAGAGAAVALNHTNPAPSAFSPVGGSGSQSGPFGGSGNGNGGGNPLPLPTSGGNGTGQGGTSGGTGSLNASALATKVDPGIVDVDSTLTYSDARAEGTGMVISSSGLVLTNNHVIDEATNVTATEVTSGKTYTARVLGYDSTDDVALIQLVGASGLPTVTLSDSSKAKVGEAVLALGNAGGQGGLPSTAQGIIQALNQSIKASDSGAGTTESLHGMIQTNTPIQEGDSGGPIVNGDGAVVGMDTAANAAGYGPSATATTGFAIPINTALSIAHQISSGKATSAVHIGLAGFMGVNVADASSGCPTGGGDGFGGFGGFAPPVSSGAEICQAYRGAPASQAGLALGDVIVSVNGTTIGSSADLTALTASSHPGDQFNIQYVDTNGSRHSTTVTLTGWAR